MPSVNFTQNEILMLLFLMEGAIQGEQFNQQEESEVDSIFVKLTNSLAKETYNA